MKLVRRIEIDLIDNNDGQKIENAIVSNWTQVEINDNCSDQLLLQCIEGLTFAQEYDMEEYTLGNSRIVFKQIRENIWK